MPEILEKTRDKLNLVLDYIDMCNDNNYHNMHDKIVGAILEAKLFLEDAEHEWNIRRQPTENA